MSKIRHPGASAELLADTLPRYPALAPPPITRPVMLSVAMLTAAALVVLVLLWMHGNL